MQRKWSRETVTPSACLGRIGVDQILLVQDSHMYTYMCTYDCVRYSSHRFLPGFNMTGEGGASVVK